MKNRQIFFLDILFVIILIVLLGFSYLSYQRIEKLKTTSDWVNHTSLVKLGVNRSLSYVVDAESGQRGYLLTHDSIFYRQYLDALPKIKRELEGVTDLTRDNPTQHRQLAKLIGIVDLRLHIIDSALHFDRTNPADITGRNKIVMRGKMVRDSSRILALDIVERENRLLKQRELQKEHADSLTPIVVLVFSVLAIVFVIFAYLKMRSETSLRLQSQTRESKSRELQQESQKMNQLLEKKVAERTRELQRQNIALENTNEELLSFNYVASHDLQEPLRKIQAFAGRILESDEQLPETTRDYFNRISNAAARMQKLLEALISYSRANNVEQDFVETDLNILLDEVKSDIREMIEDNGATVENTGLPTLKVIPSQIHQLFLNLVSNSIKYTRKDVRPKIKVTSQLLNVEDIKKPVYLHHKVYWQIAFEDNGIGFESQYEDKIFELFQRLHGKNEFQGTGIGLAICRKIAQNHYGYIFADGKPGIGATFLIYFPA